MSSLHQSQSGWNWIVKCTFWKVVGMNSGCENSTKEATMDIITMSNILSRLSLQWKDTEHAPLELIIHFILGNFDSLMKSKFHSWNHKQFQFSNFHWSIQIIASLIWQLVYTGDPDCLENGGQFSHFVGRRSFQCLLEIYNKGLIYTTTICIK